MVERRVTDQAHGGATVGPRHAAALTGPGEPARGSPSFNRLAASLGVDRATRSLPSVTNLLLPITDESAKLRVASAVAVVIRILVSLCDTLVSVFLSVARRA